MEPKRERVDLHQWHDDNSNQSGSNDQQPPDPEQAEWDNQEGKWIYTTWSTQD